MFNKKLVFTIFALNVVFFSAVLIRDANHRFSQRNSTYIGKDASRVPSTRPENSVQASQYSKERRIAASRVELELVSILAPF